MGSFSVWFAWTCLYLHSTINHLICLYIKTVAIDHLHDGACICHLVFILPYMNRNFFFVWSEYFCTFQKRTSKEIDAKEHFLQTYIMFFKYSYFTKKCFRLNKYYIKMTTGLRCTVAMVMTLPLSPSGSIKKRGHHDHSHM